ncbi:MAG: hypothetical protein RLZZ401_2449 [Pseudomonadota bacterium]
MSAQRSISLLVCALGGEGGGVLTDWLVNVARHADYPAQATSIPGVAQRTGATTYYIEVFPTPLSALNGKRPVFSLYPVPGALDALVSSELLETVRQIGHGLTTPERTRIISATGRALTTAERMVPGDGRLDTAPLLAAVRRHSAAHHLLDMAQIARDNGTLVSAVMLGAIAGSGLFPFTRTDFEAVLQRAGAGAAASLRGFAQGFEAVNTQINQGAVVTDLLQNSELLTTTPPAEMVENSSFLQAFPFQAQPLIALGHARVQDYHTTAYADLYLARLHRVNAATLGNAETVQEVARWLALWMAFDDIVRVADLKSRASRWARVRQEVKAQDADLLKVYDHFKPGVPEFAALLPTRLATRLTAWERQRTARGKTAWALALKIGTHSVLGMLALRVLAACKPLRALGSRYATEQALIEQWLTAVAHGARRHPALGLELARCGRLIKGYGSTNERGKETLLHITQHLAPGADANAAAQAVAAARNAALADDSGRALDTTLAQHGAPPRAVKEHPVRWTRMPKALRGKT